ncbi:MAG: hypothetical protein AB1921_02025 [Thermodesulfobacteriota bacterium]
MNTKENEKKPAEKDCRCAEGKKSEHEKAKGWWSRYLARLQKATGGVPPKCCG